MALTERLQILIDADSKGATREMQQFGRTAERELGKTDQKLKALSGEMIAFGSATLVAGGVAAAGLYKLADAAGDLGEATNKANVVLGTEGAAALEKFADSAAQTAGVSKRAALEAGAGFGLFVEKAGFAGEEAGKVSADLVKLAGDISSLNNVSTEEALTALSSALAGESEAVRRLGIDISDATLKQAVFDRTGEKVTGTLDQQTKTVEIINQLFAQGAVFQDDFINTSDSLANRQKALAAEFENTSAAIGASLLPAFETILGGAQSVFGAFNSLPEGAKTAAGGIAGVATAGAIAVGGFALLAGAGLRTADTFRELASRSAASDGALSRLTGTLRNADGSMTRVGIAARFAGGAIATLLVSDAIFNALNEGSGATKEFTDRLNELKIAAAESGETDLVENFAGLVAAEQNTNRLQNIWQEFGSEVEIVGTGVKADVEQVQRAFDELAKSDPAAASKTLADLEQATGQLDSNSRQYQINTEFIDRNRESLRLAADARKADERAAMLAAGATEEDVAAKEDATEAADQLKGALGRLSAVQKLSTLQFDIGAAKADSFAQALERATYADNIASAANSAGKALREIGKGLGLIPDEADKAAESTEASTEQLDRLRDSAERTDPALSRLGISLGASAAAASAFGESLDAADQFGDRLGSALGLGDAFTDFSRTFRRLPDDIDIASVSLGKLRPRTADAVRNVLALGDATRDYLSTLLKSGGSQDEVRKEAARLRAEYEAQFRQLGLNEEQLAEYIKLTGTAPEQIETAIRLSGLESSRFKLNAYLGLLEGRIPESVATQVIPLVESGNIEGAAAKLAEFAATNPAKIDVAPNGTKELKEAEDIILALPAKYDAVIAATGGYTDEQYAGLDAISQLGDAAQEYLTALVESGAPLETVRAEAARLRDAYKPFFAEFGVFGQDLSTYEETLLGISDTQVTAAFEIANFDATVFQITTVISLLEGIGELDPEVSIAISRALLDEDYEQVRELLEQEVTSTMLLDADPAIGSFEWFQDWVYGNPSTNIVGADTDPAAAAVLNLVGWVNRQFASITVGASFSGDAIVRGAEAAGRIAGEVFRRSGGFGAGGTNRDGTPDRDGNPNTLQGRRRGGPVQPGRDYLVGEEGPEIVRFGGAGTVIPAGPTADMLAGPPPLGGSDGNARLMAQIERYLAEQSGGTTINGGVNVVSPEPELAGTELIRAIRKRQWLGG